MKHSLISASPKSAVAVAPSGAGASQSSKSIRIASPSSHSRWLSGPSTSTTSQVMLPASFIARSLATAWLELSSLMIFTAAFCAA